MPRVLQRGGRGARALNEDRVVAALAELLASDAGSRVIVGIGDDAAAWQPSRSHLSVVTTDALIEGVHFLRDMPLDAIGYRALAANLSDIAAKGARPVLATIALGAPPDFRETEILEVYRGIDRLARETKTEIAGGDLSAAPVLMLSITVVGEVRKTRFHRRRGARPGDVVAVSGALGASRAGLLLRESPNALDQALGEEALRAHHYPVPRLREGAWLAASANVHAMMDLSDGLSTDLQRMAAASACQAVVECIPVSASGAAMAAHAGRAPQRFAADGGEDFELLVAIAPRAFRHLAGRYERRFGSTLHRVGYFRSGDGVVLIEGGREEPLPAGGWDHFSKR